jgi:hypothetical protein
VENTDKQVYITLPPVPEVDPKEAETQGFSGSFVLKRPTGWHYFVSTTRAVNGSTCYKDCVPW